MRLKAAAGEQGCDYLTWNDIQACVDQVNFTVQEEHERKIPKHRPPRTLARLLTNGLKLLALGPNPAWRR